VHIIFEQKMVDVNTVDGTILAQSNYQ